MPIFFDTETCGFHGPIVLFQYAENDGKIHLINIWDQKIGEIINLFEWLANHPEGIIAFNIVFDFFHIIQMYTTLLSMVEDGGINPNDILLDHIDDYVTHEPLGRDKDCLKPVTALDLMLHARKTKYQSTMDRKPIVVRRIPEVLAEPLRAELDRRLRFKDIYFFRNKKSSDGHRWKIKASTKSKFKNSSMMMSDDIIKNFNKQVVFKDLVLGFAASSSLKALAADALGLDTITFSEMQDGSGPSNPDEKGWAPFAKAISAKHQDRGKKKFNGPWPSHIRSHIIYWKQNLRAREYAENDIVYLRKLYEYFGEPELGDDDSVLACMAAAARWKGYCVDLERINNLRRELVRKVQENVEGELDPVTGKSQGFNPNYVPTEPAAVKKYLIAVMSPEEQVGFVRFESTNKKVLQDIAESEDWADSPAQERAKKVLELRDAKYNIGIYNKLLQAGRLHASVNIIGTVSGRMSGADKFNVQGIKRTKEVRSCFPLAFPGYDLNGGDFESFEVALAVASYGDPKLQEDLLRCDKCDYNYKVTEVELKSCPKCGAKESRTKLHALLAMEVFGKTYEEIMATKGTSDDLYGKGKNCVFSKIYGGNAHTWADRYGVNLARGEEAERRWQNKYRKMAFEQQKIINRFSTIKQVGGIGSRVIWKEADDYVESMLGYKRYFTLENQICKELFELANKLPPAWTRLDIPVIRRDRVQKVGGAVQSALYAAAFALQAFNTRAAINHVIQSTGAEITKAVQRKIWNLQPSGRHKWIVQPLNIHDEILVPTDPAYTKQVTRIVKDHVETYRDKVPLIAIDWKEKMKNWAKK